MRIQNLPLECLTPDELEDRHAHLQAELQAIQIELVTVQEALRAAGRWGQAGRPRKPPTHTYAEAVECHRRYQAGERTPWIIAGHNQYKRERRRESYRQKGERW